MRHWIVIIPLATTVSVMSTRYLTARFLFTWFSTEREYCDWKTFNLSKKKYIFPNKIITMATGLKKKYTQNDLRRLMNEQRAKNAPKTSTTTINSPLAKYPFQIDNKINFNFIDFIFRILIFLNASTIIFLLLSFCKYI